MRLYDPMEKKRKKKWWLPLFGLLLALSLAVVALAVAPLLRVPIAGLAPKLYEANFFVFGDEAQQLWWGRVDIGLAFVMWLLLFALGMTVALAAAGKDPAEEQAKQMMIEAKRRKDAHRRKKHKRGG